MIGTLWGTLAADASQGNTRAALEFILALGMEAAQQVWMGGVGICVGRQGMESWPLLWSPGLCDPPLPCLHLPFPP